MPMAPPRACATCGRPGCLEHRGGTRAQRTTGRRLQTWRNQMLRAGPVCAHCRLVTPDLVRDHVVPLWAGGLDEKSNTQALCVPCHDAKTKAESQWRYSPGRR
jgi:5-methylcytosine-specific restriction endonuclease McrA